jgi:hypothetical protein
MPPQLIKVIEFAKLAGVGKTAVYKARDTNKITIKKGLIDLSDPRTLEYLQAAKARKEMERQVTQTTTETQEDAIKFLPQEVRESGGNRNGVKPKSEIRKLEEARIAKQNRELDLKFRKARNELLERKDVKRVFSKLYSIQVAKFHGLSHMITPEIAVIFKSTDSAMMMLATDAIDGAVFAALEDIKKTMDEFLLSVKTEGSE